MSKIVICAVAGAAAGGGANLAFGCDFIFAADNAKFLQAFVGIGLCPDTGGVYMLPRMIGTHRAFDMFVTGRPVDAKEAFQIGLIKEITAKEDLLPKTMAFAKKLTKGPALAYRNMKKLMFESMYKDFETFMTERTQKRELERIAKFSQIQEELKEETEKVEAEKAE